MSDPTPGTSRAGAQFAQTLAVLNWFRTHPNGTFMQASRQLGIAVAQIKHELTQVSMCGLPGYYPGSLVEVSVDKTTAQVEFTAGLDRPLALNTMEAGVLLFSLEALRSTTPAEDQAAIRSVSAKIHSLLRAAGDEQESHDTAGEGPEVASAPKEEQATTDGKIEIIRQAQRAREERRLFTATYHSLSSDSLSTRELTIDHVAMVDGEAYAWAREDGREQRTYALSRMSDIHVGAEGSVQDGPTQPPHIDTQDPFDFESAEEWATLKLSPAVAWMLEYYPMWVVEESEYPIVTIPDTGAWLERFCVAYGQDIDVIETVGLSDRVRQHARAGLRAYSS